MSNYNLILDHLLQDQDLKDKVFYTEFRQFTNKNNKPEFLKIINNQRISGSDKNEVAYQFMVENGFIEKNKCNNDNNNKNAEPENLPISVESIQNGEIPSFRLRKFKTNLQIWNPSNLLESALGQHQTWKYQYNGISEDFNTGTILHNLFLLKNENEFLLSVQHPNIYEAMHVGIVNFLMNRVELKEKILDNWENQMRRNDVQAENDSPKSAELFFSAEKSFEDETQSEDFDRHQTAEKPTNSTVIELPEEEKDLIDFDCEHSQVISQINSIKQTSAFDSTSGNSLQAKPIVLEMNKFDEKINANKKIEYNEDATTNKTISPKLSTVIDNFFQEQKFFEQKQAKKDKILNDPKRVDKFSNKDYSKMSIEKVNDRRKALLETPRSMQTSSCSEILVPEIKDLPQMNFLNLVLSEKNFIEVKNSLGPKKRSLEKNSKEGIFEISKPIINQILLHHKSDQFYGEFEDFLQENYDPGAQTLYVRRKQPKKKIRPDKAKAQYFTFESFQTFIDQHEIWKDYQKLVKFSVNKVKLSENEYNVQKKIYAEKNKIDESCVPTHKIQATICFGYLSISSIVFEDKTLNIDSVQLKKQNEEKLISPYLAPTSSQIAEKKAVKSMHIVLGLLEPEMIQLLIKLQEELINLDDIVWQQLMNNQLNLVNSRFEEKVKHGVHILDSRPVVQRKDKTEKNISVCESSNGNEDENDKEFGFPIGIKLENKKPKKLRKKSKRMSRKFDKSPQYQKIDDKASKKDKNKASQNSQKQKMSGFDYLVNNPSDDPQTYVALFEMLFPLKFHWERKKIGKKSYQCIVSVILDDPNRKSDPKKCNVKCSGFGSSSREAHENTFEPLAQQMEQIFGKVQTVSQLKSNFEVRRLRDVFAAL